MLGQSLSLSASVSETKANHVTGAAGIENALPQSGLDRCFQERKSMAGCDLSRGRTRFSLLQGKICSSNLGAHSSALFTTARAAAPSATVSPITASLTKRLVLGFVKMDFVRSSPWSRPLKRCRSTVSGRCWAEANSKSLKVEAAVL